MPECPNCNQYYFGTPAECPNCHKKLPVSKPAPKPTPTLSYGSIREKQNNIGNVVQTLAVSTWLSMQLRQSSVRLHLDAIIGVILASEVSF